MATGPKPPRARLSELVAALSLGVDLGFGQPMEHVLRQCRIALRIAEHAGINDEARSTVYYTALLVNVGCHTDAYEQAKLFGDDIALKSTKYDADAKSWRSSAASLRNLGAGQPPARRLRMAVDLALGGYRSVAEMITGHAAMAAVLAHELGLSPDVQASLSGSYERWDGKGWPGDLAGDAVPLAARIAGLAEELEVAHRLGGTEAALDVATARSAEQFDPSLVTLVRREALDLFAGLEDPGTWAAVVAAEPALTRELDDAELDAALVAIADFVDLKSPSSLGHSRAASELAAAAAGTAGLGPEGVRLVRRAALVAHFGRLGVSNSIWDKPGPLGVGEWERVRLYPYLTERMLRQSTALEPYGRLAVMHLERMDGSGCPRGLPGTSLPVEARVLAAANAYQAMREPRPHRPARSPAEAAAELRSEVQSGRYDADAVAAVLTAAGHQPRHRIDRPGGLTAREVEVLRLVAYGLPTKEIAARLVISPKTASNHIEHVYAKLGVTSRAAAGLYAVRHGLLPQDADETTDR